MMPVLRPALPLLALFPAGAMGVAPTGATLTVEVGNVRAARGHVRVDLCPQALFLKDDCALEGEAPAVVGVTRVTIRNVPPGDYAAQVYLDENDNRRVDRALFGIPKEGVGFSRDARIALAPPRWADAVFAVGSAPHQMIALKLRYFLGPKGPSQ